MTTLLQAAERVVTTVDRFVSGGFTRLELVLRVQRKKRRRGTWDPEVRMRALKAGELGEPLRLET